MKKCTSSWMGALLVLAIGICSCSDDSDVNKPTPIYNYSQLRLEEEYTITQENGLTIRRDESGRVNAIETFLEPNTNYLIAPHYDAEIDATQANSSSSSSTYELREVIRQKWQPD